MNKPAQAGPPAREMVRLDVLTAQGPKRTSLRRGAENKLVLVLSAYACLRILIFAAAFPLFDNVDERLHLMSIQMYAQGHWPGKELPKMDPVLARSMIFLWSPEYGHTHEELQRNGFSGSPKENYSGVFLEHLYQEKLEEWLRRPNFEAQSPPFYYLFASVWYRLGSRIGLQGWTLLYWLRFLNAFLYASFLWISFTFVRYLFPENAFLYLAVPALIAVFPQDVFFGWNRDVLSPLVCALALLFMAFALKNVERRPTMLLIAGLFVGLSFLVEVSNFVLYGILGATLWLSLRDHLTSRLRLVSFVRAGASSLVLPLLWMLRNYWVIGDLTGSSQKLAVLGWTRNSLSTVLQHPLFTWDGLGFFLRRLTGSFWHGEYGWYAQTLRSESLDWFYAVSSGLMVLLFGIWMRRNWQTLPKVQRWAGMQSLFVVAASVSFLAVLSLAFDFHDGGYPSRIYPYLVSGRIISGALLPFMLIYAKGLDLIASRVRQWIPPLLPLTAILLVITFWDFWIRRYVFQSSLNFFALTGLTH